MKSTTTFTTIPLPAACSVLMKVGVSLYPDKINGEHLCQDNKKNNPFLQQTTENTFRATQSSSSGLIAMSVAGTVESQ